MTALTDSCFLRSKIHLFLQGTLDQWLIVYDICGAVCLIGGLFYLFGGSCELQEWAKNKPSDGTQNITDNNNV